MLNPLLAQALNVELPLGDAADTGVRWVIDTFDWLFSAIRFIVGGIVDYTELALITPSPLIMTAVFAGIALVATRSWGLPVFTIVAFLLVDAMGMFAFAMQTLALVFVATVLAVIIGVPLGILAARNERVSTTIKPILDFMQTMPSFVYLLLAVFFFRIGRVPGVMSALIFAMPPAVRLTELGIRQVDAEVVEAAHAFGARPREVLTGVQLPLARASILAGINQVIMLSLSMVVIAGLGGAPGLGAEVVRAVTRMDIGMGIEGGLGVVALAIYLDRVTAAFGREGRGRRKEGPASTDEQSLSDDDADDDTPAEGGGDTSTTATTTSGATS
ncbi:MAG: ABC transporter permease subunit [Nitriliruptoraceae bacterium]